MSWPAQNASPAPVEPAFRSRDRSQLVERVVHVQMQLRAHGVALVGTVEDHPRDPPLPFSILIVSYFLVSHFFSPRWFKRPAYTAGLCRVRADIFFPTTPGRARRQSARARKTAVPRHRRAASMSAGAVTCRFTPSLMTSTRQAAPRKVTPLMRPARQFPAGLSAPGRGRDQLDAFRPDRDRHRRPDRRCVCGMVHWICRPLKHFDLAAAVGGADQAAAAAGWWRRQSGRRTGWPDGNRCRAASRSGVMRPLSITAMRSDSASASDWSCVT